MAHIRLTPDGEQAYLIEHAGTEKILMELVVRIGAKRALQISADLQDVTAALDDILSNT